MNSQTATPNAPAPALPAIVPPQPVAAAGAATVPTAPPPSQIVTVAELPPPAPPRKLRRNGLIARLPKDERDMVNRMISNGAPYGRIVEALDECCVTVSERNVSNWATGGYLDWLQEQEDLNHHRHIQDTLLDHVRRDDPSELPEVGLQAAATRISELLLHKTVTGADIESALPKYQGLVNTLCRLNHEIFLLQEHREERTKYLGRTRELLKAKEDDERELGHIEDYYTKPPPPDVTGQQLPAPRKPQALPPAPAQTADPLPVSAPAVRKAEPVLADVR